MKAFTLKSFNKMGIAFALSTVALFSGVASPAIADTLVAPSVLAVRDVTPEYPASAMRRDASGTVTVRFDVNSNGKATNVEIVDAQPDRTFNSAVIRAVRRSDFELLNGLSDVSDVERTYHFNQELDANTALSMN